MNNTLNKKYRLIPMDEITDDAREIAKRWYDGVSEMNDIGQKHKLASDIMNYANQQTSELNSEIKRLTKMIETDLKRSMEINMPGQSHIRMEENWQRYKKLNNLK